MNNTNKSILVVGANGAMAKETIKQLLKAGVRKIVMACRTESKGILAKEEILNDKMNTQNAELSVVGGFDMNKPLAIEKAVQELTDEQPFDRVFLAAGFAVFADDYQTVEWKGKNIERSVFQNFLGSHYTLSVLKKNNLLAKNARVLLAGGEGARGIKGLIEKPTFQSAAEFRAYIFQTESNLPKYNPMNAIGISKLCGALWTTKISKLPSNNFKVIWFSPGLTSGSAGLKNLPALKRMVFGLSFKITNLFGLSQSPEAGGKKYADCLLGNIGKNGDLLGAPQGKAIGKITDQTPMNEAFSNPSLMDELWNISEELFGIFGE